MLSNDMMPDAFKVGRTTGSPHQRARDLSRATGVPLPFDVVCYVESDDCEWLETRMHQWMRHHRINDGREFFSFNDHKKPWALGLFKYNPFILGYTECDLSQITFHGFEDFNPWRYGDGPPEEPPIPRTRVELKAVA
jgi:hypothetical protein